MHPRRCACRASWRDCCAAIREHGRREYPLERMIAARRGERRRAIPYPAWIARDRAVVMVVSAAPWRTSVRLADGSTTAPDRHRRTDATAHRRHRAWQRGSVGAPALAGPGRAFSSLSARQRTGAAVCSWSIGAGRASGDGGRRAPDAPSPAAGTHGCASPGVRTVATRPAAKLTATPPLCASVVRSSVSQRARQPRGRRRSLTTTSARRHKGVSCRTGTR